MAKRKKTSIESDRNNDKRKVKQMRSTFPRFFSDLNWRLPNSSGREMVMRRGRVEYWSGVLERCIVPTSLG